MKNFLLVQGTSNCSFQVFQVPEDIFALMFPDGCDMALEEHLNDRVVENNLGFLGIFEQPIMKAEAMGIHGTYFEDNETRQIPASKREVDWDAFRSLPPSSAEHHTPLTKNIFIVTGQVDATVIVFQLTEEDFAAVFPDGRDMELLEDLIERLGEEAAKPLIKRLYQHPILKRDAMGIHGTLFIGNECRVRHIPPTKRELDWDERSLMPSQRELFDRYR